MQRITPSQKVPARSIEKLDDNPKFMANNWSGYEHFIDPTVMAFNKLTFPSSNCTIPSFDKVIPDKGKTLYGQEFTENSGINGNKQKFKNLGGIEMEVREWSSIDTDLKDVIEIGFQNKRLLFNTLIGVIVIPEQVSGNTSGATATVVSISASIVFLENIVGEFLVGEPITFLTSGATAVVVLAPETLFHQITENVNPLPRGVHEYYFDEWFETNLNPALSKNLPRLIWVNGYKDPSTRQGAVYSWTGGIATIVGITATNLFIDALTTWRSLGFSEDALGGASVIVNGVEYVLANPADLDTSSIDVTDTTGVNIGDTATAKIEVDIAPIPFDMCRQNKGYMFYGNWAQRDLYQSNAFDVDAQLFGQTYNSISGLNDAVFTGVYTGTVEKIFEVSIDSVTQPTIYYPAGVNAGANALVFDISGYTQSGITNTYKVVVYEVGGAGSLTTWGWLFLRNDIQTDFGPLQQPNGVFNSGPFTPLGGDGISFNIPDNVIGSLLPLGTGPYTSYTGALGHGDSWSIEVTSPTDTFSWSLAGVPQGNHISLSTLPILLADGVSVNFIELTGHAIGDTWTITGLPAIDRAWDNFYYALPTRRLGQGYKYRLPSNFWTMDTQEDTMYVNGSYGEWNFVENNITGAIGFQIESISLQPLKQAGANKVLYPYLTGHINDKLVYINTEKSLDTLGREVFLEKPQTGYLSDPVKLDFLASSFVGGRIKYFGKRLYVSSPEDGIMHCYDTFKAYWQPPKVFPEVGLLSIIGNDLVAHSNVRNQTFTMFTNVTDNGQAYGVEIRTPYTALGARWRSKYASMSFTEGYIQGNPKLIHTVYLGVGGCGGIFPHEISPIVCTLPDRAPFGEGPFGSHPNGSDLATEGSYFNEIYKAYSPVLQFYFLSLGLSCVSKNHSWSLLGMGMNGMSSQTGNNSLVNPSNLATNRV